jgi:hypothetical protein
MNETLIKFHVLLNNMIMPTEKLCKTKSEEISLVYS